MSKMNDLAYDIEQMYIEGISPRRIAEILECPVSMIYDWLEGENLGVAEMPQEEDYDPYSTVNS